MEMVLTILEAHVEPSQETALKAAYSSATASGSYPAGLVRTELLHDLRDATRWRIQTLWASREALDAMRGKGTPTGILIFRAAGAEPALSIFEVISAGSDTVR
jgi:quinol monooxygenase YgiN